MEEMTNENIHNRVVAAMKVANTGCKRKHHQILVEVSNSH
jgi:hypothetical protein